MEPGQAAAAITPVIPGFWGQLLDLEAAPVDWLWDGYLADGNVTLLTSQWKSGKTTLISILLARLKKGGLLAERHVRPGKAVVVSEEARPHWALRHRKLDLAHIYFICQPFRGKPNQPEWLALLDHVADLQTREGVRLLVIDTLATFLPGRNESAAGSMMEALLPLGRLTERGLAVLLVHHPAKGQPMPGQAARGSGALASFTDINLEMSWRTQIDTSERRRRILAHSRHEETPRQLVLELNAASDDYLVHGDFANDEFTDNWERLRQVLASMTEKKTRQEILKEWPDDFPRPAEMTLFRWLSRAVAAGLLCQEGDGYRNSPFRYWLPGQDKIWQQDPLYNFNQLMEASRREVEKMWR